MMRPCFFGFGHQGNTASHDSKVVTFSEDLALTQFVLVPAAYLCSIPLRGTRIIEAFLRMVGLDDQFIAGLGIGRFQNGDTGHLASQRDILKRHMVCHH